MSTWKLIENNTNNNRQNNHSNRGTHYKQARQNNNNNQNNKWRPRNSSYEDQNKTNHTQYNYNQGNNQSNTNTSQINMNNIHKNTYVSNQQGNNINQPSKKTDRSHSYDDHTKNNKSTSHQTQDISNNGQGTKQDNHEQKQIDSKSSNMDWLDNIADGMMFYCSNKTYNESINNKLFGATEQFVNEVERINPNSTAIFLYHRDRKELFGPFKAIGNGRMNINSKAFDTYGNGTSPYPAQIHIHMKYAFEHAIPEVLWKNIFQGIGKLNPKNRVRSLNDEETKQLLAVFVASGKCLGCIHTNWYKSDNIHIHNLGVYLCAAVKGYKQIIDIKNKDGYVKFGSYTRIFCEYACKYMLNADLPKTFLAQKIETVYQKYKNKSISFPRKIVHDLRQKTNTFAHSIEFGERAEDRFLDNKEKAELLMNLYKFVKWMEQYVICI